MAPESRVAPINKLSLAFTIALAAVVLGESIPWKVVSERRRWSPEPF
jgi:uncharacterized membrane protein